LELVVRDPVLVPRQLAARALHEQADLVDGTGGLQRRQARARTHPAVAVVLLEPRALDDVRRVEAEAERLEPVREFVERGAARVAHG
jgi:hypothetical protein